MPVRPQAQYPSVHNMQQKRPLEVVQVRNHVILPLISPESRDFRLELLGVRQTAKRLGSSD
jgi:hypothetical protein